MHCVIMLIEFSIKNFGPFKDKAVFSIESTALDGNEGNLLDSPLKIHSLGLQ